MIIKSILDSVWGHTFNVLSAAGHLDPGRAATAAEQAVRAVLEEDWAEPLETVLVMEPTRSEFDDYLAEWIA